MGMHTYVGRSKVAATLTSAHTVITYPGWRGDNLITNDTFPYGMQWMYPCGAVALQPGWFQGHQTAFMYVNLGFGTDGPDGGPPNMSFPMVSPFQIIGPSANPYPGTICLPQVPLPANTTVQAGDNATIQVVEIAKHGAALFSCVDITFADPGDARIPDVNSSNCFNSNDMGFADVYTVVTRESNANPNVTSGADETVFWYFGRHNGARSVWNYIGLAPVVLGAAWLVL
ncbi:hypothetical protein M406DRAFT_65324 [Cryphonectria parasitica EP155]|uniref:Copper acquisition factor BIM1-like domain-containing protein n=1 Tax=Cryphonectria parasitica (strain ATCC 38755 / EP155) TaxID=660469 RepID=A0A9P4XSH3_CRYP1|nr:uncharacterized protein M406DRAFT_65324 [Cryphonectria parasitica EP155]KAF3759955.1 hypothetical protein M406DRAFT_65324 [Cryphonectria parasitica EP155]